MNLSVQKDQGSELRQILVEDSLAFRAAEEPSGRIWTCNPGLRYALDLPGEVQLADGLVGQDSYDRMTTCIQPAIDKIRATLDEVCQTQTERRFVGSVHAAELANLIFIFAYKGLILDRWLARTAGEDRIVIGCPELEPVRNLRTAVAWYDHVFAALASRLSSLVSVLPVTQTDAKVFLATFEHVSPIDKVFNIANRTASGIAYQFLRRVKIDDTKFGPKGSVIVVRTNEVIEDAFLSLAWRGWRISHPGFRMSNPPVTEESFGRNLAVLLEPVWQEFVADFEYEEVAAAGWEIVSGRAADVLNQHSIAYRETAEMVDRELATLRSDGKPVIAIGSGLFGAWFKLLAECFRERGVTVIDIEHGTFGLQKREQGVAAALIEPLEAYCAHTPHAARLSQTKVRAKTRFDVVGSPKMITHARFPRIQRYLQRKRLDLKDSSHPTLMYASSLMSNNQPWGAGTCPDALYVRFYEELVEQLENFAGEVRVKPYPVHRFADPEPIWRMPLPDNAAIAPLSDFRQLRWAADIFLLDICSSTMGWAMGCGKPLIFVDNPQGRMAKDVIEPFDRAAFYVNAREEGWQAKLSELLADPERLFAEWRAKGRAREEFLDEFVFGPRDSVGRMMSNVLNKVAAPV